MKFLLGTKDHMTQIFRDDGHVVPVTVIKAEPNTVTAVRTTEKHGYQSVQLGYGKKSLKKVAKPQQGQTKGLGVFRWIREFRVTDAAGIEAGKKIDVSTFQPGDVLQVTGTSKGKGFAGVVKRHHFRGGPASHGHKDNLRAPGSIGATFPQHVIKGMRMAGHMGDARVTVKNLTVIEVRPEKNELLVSGAVPGAKNGLVLLQSL